MINNAKKLAKKQGNKLADAAPIVNKLASTMASEKVNCSVCLKSRVGLERCLCTFCAVCRHRPDESLCHCTQCGLPTCQSPGCTFYSYRVGADPIRMCPRCLLPALFGGLSANPYSANVSQGPPSPLTSDKVKDVLAREFATQSMHHYLVRKGHYHAPQFISAAVERGATHLARVYTRDPPAPHLSVILDMLWYISSQAYRKQPFLRGSFQLEDPGYRLYDFLRSYSKAYPRRKWSGKGGFGSSHLVDFIDYYGQVNVRIYGGGDIPEYDQHGIDFKGNRHILPTYEGHLLFGKIPPKREVTIESGADADCYLFVKLEGYGTNKGSDIVSHNIQYASGIFGFKQLDEDDRREDVPKDMLRDFCAIVDSLGSDRYIHLDPEYTPELAKKRGSTYGFSYQMKVVNSLYAERPDLSALKSFLDRYAFKHYHSGERVRLDHEDFRFGQEMILNYRELAAGFNFASQPDGNRYMAHVAMHDMVHQQPPLPSLPSQSLTPMQHINQSQQNIPLPQLPPSGSSLKNSTSNFTHLAPIQPNATPSQPLLLPQPSMTPYPPSNSHVQVPQLPMPETRQPTDFHHPVQPSANDYLQPKPTNAYPTASIVAQASCGYVQSPPPQIPQLPPPSLPPAQSLVQYPPQPNAIVPSSYQQAGQSQSGYLQQPQQQSQSAPPPHPSQPSQAPYSHQQLHIPQFQPQSQQPQPPQALHLPQQAQPVQSLLLPATALQHSHQPTQQQPTNQPMQQQPSNQPMQQGAMQYSMPQSALQSTQSLPSQAIQSPMQPGSMQLAPYPSLYQSNMQAMQPMQQPTTQSTQHSNSQGSVQQPTQSYSMQSNLPAQQQSLLVPPQAASLAQSQPGHSLIIPSSQQSYPQTMQPMQNSMQPAIQQPTMQQPTMQQPTMQQPTMQQPTMQQVAQGSGQVHYGTPHSFQSPPQIVTPSQPPSQSLLNYGQSQPMPQSHYPAQGQGYQANIVPPQAYSQQPQTQPYSQQPQTQPYSQQPQSQPLLRAQQANPPSNYQPIQPANPVSYVQPSQSRPIPIQNPQPEKEKLEFIFLSPSPNFPSYQPTPSSQPQPSVSVPYAQNFAPSSQLQHSAVPQPYNSSYSSGNLGPNNVQPNVSGPSYQQSSYLNPRF